MAFVAAPVRLITRLSPQISPRQSERIRLTHRKRVRGSLRSYVHTPHNSQSCLQLSYQGNGGGKIPNDNNVCCEGEHEEHRSFSSPTLMLFCSTSHDFSLYRVARKASPSYAPIVRILQQLRICHILLALNVAVFVLQTLSGPGILMAGAKVNTAIANGQYYRLFSPMFLHASATHLAINSFSLHSTGPSVESWFGKNRFLWLYMVSGVCGNALSFVCTPTPAVGASGAIFGLVGASGVILARHSKLLGPRARRGLQSLAYIVVMNFGMGLSPGSRIDNFGHLGGFLGGIAYSYLFGPRLVPLRLRSGRTIMRDEPISSLVVRDVRNHLRFVRKLFNVN